MVLDALGYMNNAEFGKKIVNDNIVLDMFIICQRCTSNLKNIVLICTHKRSK